MIENSTLTIGEMTANLNTAYESVQDILFNDLPLRRQKRPDLLEAGKARSNNAIVFRNSLTKNGTCNPRATEFD